MNLRHFHRSNTEEYQRELQELFNHKLALARSLKALIVEHEELQKVIFRNGTHYPESTDRVGTPHPELQHLVVHKARNGKHVWSYHPELNRIHDRNLMQLLGGQKIADRNNLQLPNRLASLQKPTVSAVRSFANDLINNPDRHVMSANTDPTKPKDHSEMRVRHLISALTGSDGYEIKDHPEGFEVYAPRHSKSQKADDIATRWIYNAAKKDLRSERIYPKSPNGGSYGTKFGKSIRPRPSSNLGRRQADARKSAAQRPRPSEDAVGKTEIASKLLKAEDEAGMTAYPLKDGYSIHHETSQNGYDIWAIGHSGQRAGTFMICTDETRRGRPFVSWAGLEKPHRGKGIGVVAYKALAAHYGGLDSDRNSTSVDALKAWRRAGGKQLKTKTAFGDPRYTLEGDKKRPPIVWNKDLKKSSDPLAPLIQQAKANLAAVHKVASQEPRSMLFGNKTGTGHGFVSLDPSKPNQWRVTHFIRGQPSGHTEANSFSDAIQKAHSYGYNVSKELSEEDMSKGQSLEKTNASKSQNMLTFYHGSDTLPIGKKPTKGGFLALDKEFAQNFGNTVHEFVFPSEKILDLRNKNHLEILKTKYPQSDIDFIKGSSQDLPNAFTHEQNATERLEKLKNMALSLGFHGAYQKESDWPNQPVSVEIYNTKHLVPKQNISKSEDLEKGARGDWEKEGYRLEHYKDQHGTHNVSAYDKNSNLVGYANFKNHLVPDIHDVYLTSHPDYMVGWDVAVHPDHQRKGLASAMYRLAEEKSGKKILQGGTTNEGSAFWKQPNKKFGNLTIDDKINIKPLAAKKSMNSEPIKKSEDFSRVSSVVVATDDKMLMLQRRDNNKWTFPGGHLNDDETHLEGAVRELWEEAGIRANPDEMILLGNKKTFQNKDIYVYLYKINSEVNPSAANDPDKEAQKFAWLPHVLPEDIKENLYIPVGDNSSLSMFSVWLLRQKTNKLKELVESKKSV